MTSGAKAQTAPKGASSVTLAGDVTGPSSANTVVKINGSPLGTTTGATTGYVLSWNGSAWVPAAATTSVTMGGDVTGNSGSSTVAKINGSPLGTTTGATSGQYLAWNGSAWVPTTAAAGGVTSFNTRTGAVVSAVGDYLAVPTGGLTGATAATRFVGGTINGAPSSGTFAVGDFIVDETASIWVNIVAGTPGTWSTTISNHITLRSATATSKYNEITLFQGSTASQTISAASSPIDSATWTIINNSTVPVTAGFASNAMYPLGSASTVTSLTVPVNAAYSFVNYNGGNWYMVSSNNIANLQGTLGTANGGTGLTTIGTAGQVLTVNSGATGLQYSTPTTTTSVTMGGDVTGNSATSTVAKLQGTSVSTTAPTSNQVLTYNSGTTSWTPTTPTAAALTYVTGNIGTNVTLAANPTVTTVFTTSSLSVGTWLISMNMTYNNNQTQQCQSYAAFNTAVGTFYGSWSVSTGNSGLSGQVFFFNAVTFIAVITTAGSLDFRSVNGAAGSMTAYASVGYTAGQNTTGYSAVKIG